MTPTNREPVSAELRQQVCYRDGGRCWYCGVQTGWGQETFHLDHQLARSRGGKSDIANCVVACGYDNLNKETLTVEVYRRIVRGKLEAALELLKRYLRGTEHDGKLDGVSFSEFKFFGERQ